MLVNRTPSTLNPRCNLQPCTPHLPAYRAVKNVGPVHTNAPSWVCKNSTTAGASKQPVQRRKTLQQRVIELADSADAKTLSNEGLDMHRLDSYRVPSKFTFSVEFELLFPEGVTCEKVQRALQEAGIPEWSVKKERKLKFCANDFNCFPLEVISPPLQGKAGCLQLFTACTHVLKPLGARVNRTTGMHVQVKHAEGWTLDQLKALCKNFLSVEEYMESLMPLSRRQNSYCMPFLFDDIGALYESIDAAKSIDGLRNLMNPSGRYYKLNLHALEPHGTVEFRQPSGTQNPAKALAYVLMFLKLAKKSVAGHEVPWHLESERAMDRLFKDDKLLMDWIPRRVVEIVARNDS